MSLEVCGSKWLIEYDDSGWTTLAASQPKIMEELNGHEETTFYLKNDAAHRAIIAEDRDVKISYDGTIIYEGLLSGVEYGPETLKCLVYNEIYEILKKRTITGTYPVTSAGTLFSAICGTAGVSAGTCPAGTFSVRFDDTYCYDAIQFLSKALKSDYWTEGGTLYIGTRGTLTSTVTFDKNSYARVDRSKKRDHILIKGVTEGGAELWADAGTGSLYTVFRDVRAIDQTTLEALADEKLDELNTNIQNITIYLKPLEGIPLYPGDMVPITSTQLALNGTYEIKRITKSPEIVKAELSHMEKRFDQILEERLAYEDLGIYILPQASPSETLQHSNDASKETQSLTYVKLKEIECGNSFGGTIRLKFFLDRGLEDGYTEPIPVYGKVYKNGTAIGTECTVTDYGAGQTFSQDFSGPFYKDDLLQIYAHATYSDPYTSIAVVSNFRIYYDLNKGTLIFSNQDP